MVQWSQRCWDQLRCIYENAQWSYAKKKNHGEKLYKENVQQRKALQRKYTAVKSSTKKICSEEKRYKCNQCGGKGAMVTAVLGSVKMLSPPPLITPTLHRNIRPGHKILTSTSAKGPLDFKRFQIIASSDKNVLNVKSLNIPISKSSQPWRQIKEPGCPVSPNFVYWFCCPYLYIELEEDKIKR